MEPQALDPLQVVGQSLSKSGVPHWGGVLKSRANEHRTESDEVWGTNSSRAYSTVRKYLLPLALQIKPSTC